MPHTDQSTLNNTVNDRSILKSIKEEEVLENKESKFVYFKGAL